MEDTTMQSTMANLNGEEEESFYNREPTPWPLGILILIATAIWLLIIIAIIGNTMTIIAYITDKALHNVYNYFIFHLAIADLLLAAVSMPLHSIFVFKGNMWPFGEYACKTWLAFDYAVCCQTNFMMIILSVDRLLLVSLGVKYSRVVTMKIAHIEMALSWTAVFLIYFPSLFGWEAWTGESWVPYDKECDVEYANSPIMMTLSSLFDPIILIATLTTLNIVLYIKIRNRNKVKPKQEGSQTTKTAYTTATSGASAAVTNANDSNKDDGGQGQAAATSAAKETHDDKTNQGKPMPARRDAKAFRFLAILVIAFLICWGPYTIMLIITSFCEVMCFDVHSHEFLVWLLWAKSAINPFLYAYNSQVYRDNFKKYIMFWKRFKCC